MIALAHSVSLRKVLEFTQLDFCHHNLVCLSTVTLFSKIDIEASSANFKSVLVKNKLEMFALKCLQHRYFNRQYFKINSPIFAYIKSKNYFDQYRGWVNKKNYSVFHFPSVPTPSINNERSLSSGRKQSSAFSGGEIQTFNARIHEINHQ
jgi:hypothetical protein